ncbi:hypothetical protein J7T55_015494 [Diaporthe amygdali]|uniref:uncharacterized protein n=1 Tax=Phomopsis amygdali TaxID=1214568 RepID=UPI0022FEF344|nr:uncharacterized protein J7T55_015494 [Diaporthe amygdali]KAJ0120761.1 hypothetical protein J7T55_015494 [Diaporthe amygdali]
MLTFQLYSAALVASMAPLGPFAWAQEAPCDAYSHACLNVIQANTCFAAYIRGNNVTEMLRCVNVSNQTLATEEVSIVRYHKQGNIRIADESKLCACYGCTEPSVQKFVVSSNICQ